MMRLCKKIRNEVADYFYGGNNFRFSNDDGIVVMAAFFHTIRPKNRSFLQRVTVQIPNRQVRFDHTVESDTAWGNLEGVLTHRGMRMPHFGFKAKHKANGRKEGEFCYDKSVYMCFRQLRGMPNLRRLEITIPWHYKFFVDDSISRNNVIPGAEDDAAYCNCPAQDVEAMSPEDRIRHTVEEHARDGQYWDLLADLKENAASKDLTVALVTHYGTTEARPENGARSQSTTFNLRQARLIAAYAALMGYKMGHARWETQGPRRGSYQVLYT